MGRLLCFLGLILVLNGCSLYEKEMNKIDNDKFEMEMLHEIYMQDLYEEKIRRR